MQELALALAPEQTVQHDETPVDVRETMRRLPALLQLPLTYLTGKAHTGQHGPKLTPTFHLATALGSLAIGLIFSAVAWSGPNLLLLVLGWAVTLHGMRNLRMLIFHQCAHRNMWGKARADRLVGRIIAAGLVVQSFQRYSSEHISDHHAARHMTLHDPTVQAMLVTLRLRPGMTRQQMWRQIIALLCSPVFHARFARARVRSYVHGATPAERRVALSGYLLLAALLTLLHGWMFFLVAWALPLFFFFQISNVLRLCVEHTFPAKGVEVRRGRAYMAGLSNAIFLGEPVPGYELTGVRRAYAWLRWALRMALIHFPSRYLVLTGDTVVHDYHHRSPMSREWAGYLFARQRDLEAGHPGWPPYREVWGLIPAINLVLDSLASADADEFDPDRLADISDRELFAAFDD
ncbi:MAG: fatty acid desaturase [Mycobacterium sp.]|uniref:fatty acid desaturase n=1 Tax=Mycobacterium sp. TaxID=1785 RepID=UPI001EB82C4C|nr:fatty acid desaturase [Mycobacterium sp.]MBW0018504.1 fatty acid desaturase [Mycobacterium sp.]